jgi:hypothetical protein
MLHEAYNTKTLRHEHHYHRVMQFHKHAFGKYVHFTGVQVYAFVCTEPVPSIVHFEWRETDNNKRVNERTDRILVAIYRLILT